MAPSRWPTTRNGSGSARWAEPWRT
jgi:hypothetical protein